MSVADDLPELGVICELDFAGGSLQMDPAEWDRIDALWTEYVDSGKTRDRVVDLRSATGAEYRFLISAVQGMDRRTREQREAARRNTLAMDAEAKADGMIDK